MAGKRGPGERVTLSAIKDTYFAGDYETCLSMCDSFSHRDAKDTAEIVLLRARCLIPLGRGDHAVEALRGLRIADEHHDEYITGRMLMSAAYVSLGKYDEALEIARKAYDEIGDVHPTVRAELTLNLAIAHYRKGQYAAASRLLDLILETEDIVYVRALQFRGGVAWSSGDFVGSLDKFREAALRIKQCRHQDRFIEAHGLFSLTYLCSQLPRLDLWPDVSKRIEEFDWSASGVTAWRYWILLESSYITEMLGDLETTVALATLAEEIAPDSTALIGAWCRLAEVFGQNGERRAHAYFTKKAVTRYDAIPRDSRLREHWPLPLDVAEQILLTDSPLSASRLVTYFSEVIAPTIKSVGGDGRKIESRYALIRGLLENQRGNRSLAREAYQRALDICRTAGLQWSAAIIAYHLFVLTGEEQYETFINEALRDVSDQYWVKARLAKGRIEARLTNKQLEVVRLIAEGKSNKEIASARGISVSRAKNTVAEIFAIVGVQSRAELATLATTRGLLQPTQ